MRVLELSTGTAAACGGLLLAELGYAVDRAILRPRHPMVDPDDERAHDVFLHRGKRCVQIAQIELSSYDVIIEDCGEETLEEIHLGYADIRRQCPEMVLISLSPFGMTGPYRQWSATDINAQAAGGVLHVSGYKEEGPRKLPGDCAAMIAGIHGATAAIATFFGIQRGVEHGLHIDISAQDTLMQHWTRHVADYAYSGMRLGRQPKEPEGIHFRHTERASDGWLFMLALRQPWQDVAAFLGLGEFLTPQMMEPGAEQPWDAMREAFPAAVGAKTRYEWFADAADLGWTFAPVEDPWDVADGPQTQARKSMQAATIDDRTIKVPGLPFRFDDDGEDK